MGDLSIKGILRMYTDTSNKNQLSLREQLSSASSFPPLPPGDNVRPKLEVLARKIHEFTEYEIEEDCEENTFSCDPVWRQTWTHILVKVRLIWDLNEYFGAIGFPIVPVSQRAALMDKWKKGIEKIWNNKWGCKRQGEATCKFSFEVRWVDSGKYRDVVVLVCDPNEGCRENASKFYDTTSGGVAAHEFGHWIGLLDEYSAPDECSNRNPVNTQTVMDDNSNCVPARLMDHLARRLERKDMMDPSPILAKVVPIPEYVWNPNMCI